MNSFNVYGQTTKTIGGSTPVWLGTVKPVPVGARLVDVVPGYNLPAGAPIKYEATTNEVSTPRSLDEANAYLYNDVHMEESAAADTQATCAVVLYHPEGLLIERAMPEITEEQIAALQAKIPGVLLVRG